MRVLVVGGAGYVGTIIRPALAEHHDYYCYDRTKIEELGERSIVGDVGDSAAVKRVVKGAEAIVYLAMGVRFTDQSVETTTALERYIAERAKAYWL